MAELKTKPTDHSVSEFFSQIESETIRNDCKTIAQLMENLTGEKPILWGSSIIGFGKYSYQYASGQKDEWPLIAFSPRKHNIITIYIMTGFEKVKSYLSLLGKYKTAKSCLYIKK